MPNIPTALTTALRGAAIASVAALACAPAAAEKADRGKQMIVESDRPGSLDLQRNVMVFNGNVHITQGTLQLRADHVEVREMPDGYRAAVAVGSGAAPASYRQKRDGVDETVEGSADRIEFDGRTDVLRFVGNGAVRRLRGTVPADEVTGALITWDANAEVFSVAGGVASAANPQGRVRAVLSPRDGPASAPAATASSSSSTTELQPNRALGERR